MNLENFEANYSTRQTDLFDTPVHIEDHCLDGFSVKCLDSEDDFGLELVGIPLEAKARSAPVIACKEKSRFTESVKHQTGEKPNPDITVLDSFSLDGLLKVVRAEMDSRGVETVVEECANHCFLGR